MSVIFVVIYFALFALVLYRARSPVTSHSSQANEPVSGFATDVALRDNYTINVGHDDKEFDHLLDDQGKWEWPLLRYCQCAGHATLSTLGCLATTAERESKWFTTNSLD